MVPAMKPSSLPLARRSRGTRTRPPVAAADAGVAAGRAGDGVDAGAGAGRVERRHELPPAGAGSGRAGRRGPRAPEGPRALVDAQPSRVGLISSAPAEDPEYDAAVAQLRARCWGATRTRSAGTSTPAARTSTATSGARRHSSAAGWSTPRARRSTSSRRSSSSGCARAASRRRSASRAHRSSTSRTERCHSRRRRD